ncbi:hypothetical protein J6590_075764 [Homalodisca vitripennis]|nr:hypothetical protein J6590_075764 [Homalodisca vitripennis]
MKTTQRIIYCNNLTLEWFRLQDSRQRSAPVTVPTKEQSFVQPSGRKDQWEAELDFEIDVHQFNQTIRPKSTEPKLDKFTLRVSCGESTVYSQVSTPAT